MGYLERDRHGLYVWLCVVILSGPVLELELVCVHGWYRFRHRWRHGDWRSAVLRVLGADAVVQLSCVAA